MLRTIIVLALLMPALVQAQDKKKSAEQVWNELYSKREGKEHQFNKFLAESVKGRTPGKALDIGMGQGRNSMFLAALGWEVTINKASLTDKSGGKPVPVVRLLATKEK